MELIQKLTPLLHNYMEKCKCSEAGFCPYRKMDENVFGGEMPPYLFNLCQTNPQYRAAFWGVEIPKTVSNIAFNFSLSTVKKAAKHIHKDLSPYLDTITRLGEITYGKWSSEPKEYSHPINGNSKSVITFVPYPVPSWAIRVFDGSIENAGLSVFLQKGGNFEEENNKVRYWGEFELGEGIYTFKVTR